MDCLMSFDDLISFVGWFGREIYQKSIIIGVLKYIDVDSYKLLYLKLLDEFLTNMSTSQKLKIYEYLNLEIIQLPLQWYEDQEFKLFLKLC